MKKLFFLACVAAFCLCSFASTGRADDAAEVVCINVQEENTEPAKPVPYDDPTEHALAYSDVCILARLAWSSPLRSTTQKKALMYVAVNRVGTQPYGNTLAEVVNTTEFPWYDKDAHISEENERLARAVLNEWLSEKDGLWINRLVPRSGVLTRFVGDNRKIQVLDKNGACVWDAG